MPSKIQVDQIAGASGNTVTVPSGQTLDISSATLSLPSTVVTTTGTQTLTNKTIGVSQLTGTLGVANGGTGLTSLGTASQVLRVNSGATALEFATAPSGKVLQVINTVKTDTFSTTSSSFVVVTGLTATITPSSSANKILVMVALASGSNSGTNAGGAFRLYRDGSEITAVNGNTAGSRTSAWSQSSAPVTSPWYMKSNTLIYLHSPSTTSSTTYQVYARSQNQGTFVNQAYDDSDEADRVRLSSTITLMEIAG